MASTETTKDPKTKVCSGNRITRRAQQTRSGSMTCSISSKKKKNKRSPSQTRDKGEELIRTQARSTLKILNQGASNLRPKPSRAAILVIPMEALRIKGRETIMVIRERKDIAGMRALLEEDCNIINQIAAVRTRHLILIIIIRTSTTREMTKALHIRAEIAITVRVTTTRISIIKGTQTCPIATTTITTGSRATLVITLMRTEEMATTGAKERAEDKRTTTMVEATIITMETKDLICKASIMQEGNGITKIRWAITQEAIITIITAETITATTKERLEADITSQAMSMEPATVINRMATTTKEG